MRSRVPSLAADVLGRASLAAVAVHTGRGVHVSPQAFAWAAGRVWLVAPAGSLKARAVRKRRVAGVTWAHADVAVVTRGRARLVDLGARPDALPAAALGALAYGHRNGALAVGLAIDALTGRMGVPGPRVALCVEPRAWAVLRDGEVVATTGEWPNAGAAPAARAPRRRVAFDALPTRVRAVVESATDAHVGWPGPAGPVALPATVDDLAFGRVCVAAAAVELLGVPDGEGCVMVHASPGVRPARYAGVLLRGPLVVGGAAGVRARTITVRPQRLTSWQGYRSSTLPVGAA